MGIGENDRSVNPLARDQYLLSQFKSGGDSTLPSGGQRFELDTCFGLPGRPQSATNQTAILTGRPAPQEIGRHQLGFPNAVLRNILAGSSIVRRIKEAGGNSAFANAYPAGYLDALGLAHRPSPTPDVEIPLKYQRKVRASASTLAMAAGGVELRTLEDARNGEGLTHDIEGIRARTRGFEVPLRSTEDAAKLFWRIAQTHDFTFFEHYLADEAGHAQDWEASKLALSVFDRFSRQVIDQRPADAVVMICSDHGNVEDLSTRGHTRNDVPFLYFGDSPCDFPVRTVADVGLAVLHEILG